jgi:L-alanine-DL-glutamate epimerase-like enolase superfamily enzyme
MSVIAQIEVRALDSDHSVRWTERAPTNALTTTLVRITDSDGCYGLGGYDSYTPRPRDLSVLEAVHSLSPVLVGRDSDCRETFAHQVRIGVMFPFSPAAVSILDVALWDLAARRREMPLYKLLGGARERIQAYASLETLEHSDDYLETVAAARDEGLRAVKVHAWGDPDRDVTLLARLREAHPDLILMHDAEGVYDRHSALHVARRLESLDFRWFEAPLPDHDFAGYRELRKRVDLPILAAGYAMWDVHQFAEALRDPPWTALRAEIGSTLGITSLCRLIALADAFDMDLEPVSYGHTLHQLATLHVMLANDNVRYFELPYPMEPWEHGVLNPVRPDANGMVEVPRGDGLGIELDWAWIEAHTAGKLLLTD